MSAEDYLEWVVEKEFCLEMEDAGWITLKGDKVRRGFPDQFLFGPGARTVIVEFKAQFAKKKRRGEKLQDFYRQQLKDLGFEVYKIRGKEEANELRDRLLAEGTAARRD